MSVQLNSAITDETEVEADEAWRPGLVFYSATVAVLAIGLYGATLPEANIGWMLISGGLLLLIGLVWLVFLVAAAWDEMRRLYDRWDYQPEPTAAPMTGPPRAAKALRTSVRWLGIPVISVVCIALIPPVHDTRFDLSRSALDTAAEAALADDTPGAGWIGLYPIAEVVIVGPQAVAFEVYGSAGCGLIRAPLGDRTNIESGQIMDPVEGDWWTWCSSRHLGSPPNQ
jgi:hypothetical protein